MHSLDKGICLLLLSSFISSVLPGYCSVCPSHRVFIIHHITITRLKPLDDTTSYQLNDVDALSFVLLLSSGVHQWIWSLHLCRDVWLGHCRELFERKARCIETWAVVQCLLSVGLRALVKGDIILVITAGSTRPS